MTLDKTGNTEAVDFKRIGEQYVTIVIIKKKKKEKKACAVDTV